MQNKSKVFQISFLILVVECKIASNLKILQIQFSSTNTCSWISYTKAYAEHLGVCSDKLCMVLSSCTSAWEKTLINNSVSRKTVVNIKLEDKQSTILLWEREVYAPFRTAGMKLPGRGGIQIGFEGQVGMPTWMKYLEVREHSVYSTNNGWRVSLQWKLEVEGLY